MSDGQSDIAIARVKYMFETPTEKPLLVQSFWLHDWLTETSKIIITIIHFVGLDYCKHLLGSHVSSQSVADMEPINFAFKTVLWKAGKRFIFVVAENKSWLKGWNS